MKTLVLKRVLPFMVFMLAIVFAFASEKTTVKNESSFIPGFIFKEGWCQPATRDCNNLPGPVCKEGGLNVYLMPNETGTYCSTVLTHFGI